MKIPNSTIVILLSIICFPTSAICQDRMSDYTIKHGTSILAIVMQDSIWIAADTREGENEKAGRQVDKIYKTRRYYYAFSGLGSIYNKRTKKTIFDAKAIMESILKRNLNSVDTIFKIFNDSVSRQLSSFMCKLRISDPRLFNTLTPNDIVLEYMLAFYKEGKRVFKSCSLMLSEQTENCQIYVRQILTNTEPYEIFMSGNHDYIKKFLSKNPSYFSGWLNIKEKLVCLIKIEAKHDTVFVGMPADVLLIKKNSHKWYRKIKDCTLKE